MHPNQQSNVKHQHTRNPAMRQLVAVTFGTLSRLANTAWLTFS